MPRRACPVCDRLLTPVPGKRPGSVAWECGRCERTWKAGVPATRERQLAAAAAERGVVA